MWTALHDLRADRPPGAPVRWVYRRWRVQHAHGGTRNGREIQTSHHRCCDQEQHAGRELFNIRRSLRQLRLFLVLDLWAPCLLGGYFFFGTFAPFSRASDSPMAMACLRLFTVPPLPPLPDLSVPFFLRCMALFTDLPAALPYLRPLDFFFELELFLFAIVPP